MLLVPVTRSASDLARSFDRLFDDRFLDSFFPGAAAPVDAALRRPTLDVAETDKGYSVSLDLPGVAKEDVKITIHGRRVSVSAQSQREQTTKDGERLITSSTSSHLTYQTTPTAFRKQHATRPGRTSSSWSGA